MSQDNSAQKSKELELEYLENQLFPFLNSIVNNTVDNSHDVDSQMVKATKSIQSEVEEKSTVNQSKHLCDTNASLGSDEVSYSGEMMKSEDNNLFDWDKIFNEQNVNSEHQENEAVNDMKAGINAAADRQHIAVEPQCTLKGLNMGNLMNELGQANLQNPFEHGQNDNQHLGYQKTNLPLSNILPITLHLSITVSQPGQTYQTNQNHPGVEQAHNENKHQQQINFCPTCFRFY